MTDLKNGAITLFNKKIQLGMSRTEIESLLGTNIVHVHETDKKNILLYTAPIKCFGLFLECTLFLNENLYKISFKPCWNMILDMSSAWNDLDLYDAVKKAFFICKDELTSTLDLPHNLSKETNSFCYEFLNCGLSVGATRNFEELHIVFEVK